MPKANVSTRLSAGTCALVGSLLVPHQALAADNFIQLYIAGKGGCGGPESPLTYVLVGQDIRTPFGKAAADWTDDDLASLKTVLATCEMTSARRGNRYNLDEIKQESDRLLSQIPRIVAQARDQAQAEAQQLEARRRSATARIDEATQARLQTKASAEAEVSRLEDEATKAEAESRDAQRRADAEIQRAGRARDEARAKADAIASLEQSVLEDARALPQVRKVAPGELSELVPNDSATDTKNSASQEPVAVTTAVDARACKTIDEVSTSGQQTVSPDDKVHPATEPSGTCLAVTKGTKATVQAAGAGGDFRGLCVALKGRPGCYWMAKAAFAPRTSDNRVERPGEQREP